MAHCDHRHLCAPDVCVHCSLGIVLRMHDCAVIVTLTWPCVLCSAWRLMSSGARLAIRMLAGSLSSRATSHPSMCCRMCRCSAKTTASPTAMCHRARCVAARLRTCHIDMSYMRRPGDRVHGIVAGCMARLCTILLRLVAHCFPSLRHRHFESCMQDLANAGQTKRPTSCLMVMEKPLKATEEEDEDITTLYTEVSGKLQKLEYL